MCFYQFLVDCHFKLSFVHAEPKTSSSEENAASPGIQGRGDTQTLDFPHAGFLQQQLTSIAVFLFPLHLHDSLQKIDFGREWIIGVGEAFQFASFLLAVGTKTSFQIGNGQHGIELTGV